MSNVKNYAIPFIYSLVVLATLTFSSCKREVEDRLPGDWNYTESGTLTVLYDGSTSTQEINNTGTVTFADNGTGTITIGTVESSVTWETLNDTINITKGGTSMSYFVTNNEKTLQEWEAKHVENGVDFTFTTDSKLTLTQ